MYTYCYKHTHFRTFIFNIFSSLAIFSSLLIHSSLPPPLLFLAVFHPLHILSPFPFIIYHLSTSPYPFFIPSTIHLHALYSLLSFPLSFFLTPLPYAYTLGHSLYPSLSFFLSISSLLLPFPPLADLLHRSLEPLLYTLGPDS